MEKGCGLKGNSNLKSSGDFLGENRTENESSNFLNSDKFERNQRRPGLRQLETVCHFVFNPD